MTEVHFEINPSITTFRKKWILSLQLPYIAFYFLFTFTVLLSWFEFFSYLGSLLIFHQSQFKVLLEFWSFSSTFETFWCEILFFTPTFSCLILFFIKNACWGNFLQMLLNIWCMVFKGKFFENSLSQCIVALDCKIEKYVFSRKHLKC